MRSLTIPCLTFRPQLLGICLLAAVGFWGAPAARADFQITSLAATGSHVVDHSNFTSGDIMGMAISSKRAFVSGWISTGRFQLSELHGGAQLFQLYGMMVSDLRTGKVYALAAGSTPLQGSGTATKLLEIHESTGALTGVSISLSMSIRIGPSTGFFSGDGRVVIHDGVTAYNIALPSGAVTNLGALAMSNWVGCANGNYWGVVEDVHEAGSPVSYLVYVHDATTIVRTRVPPAKLRPSLPSQISGGCAPSQCRAATTVGTFSTMEIRSLAEALMEA